MPKHFRFRWDGQHDNEETDWTFKHVNWDALLAEVRRLTNDQDCLYDGRYHAGGRHIVRRIIFSRRDDIWLAKVPIVPGIEPKVILKWWTPERKFTMESEIATMMFLARQTTVKVPNVFLYGTAIDRNNVNLPYLVMECMQGNMLFDMGGPEKLTAEQRGKVRASIADIQLANTPLEKIGSLLLESDGTFGIGPLVTTFGFCGPFSTPLEYLKCWASNTNFKNPTFLKENTADSPTLGALKDAAKAFPNDLILALKAKPPTASKVYPITHKDFLPHNLLFDDEYNVVGVIDWEGAYSAPFDIFVALTGIYFTFDRKLLQMVPKEEGEAYRKAVFDEEDKKQYPHKVSLSFGSKMGDIGYCMSMFEGGSIVQFSHVIDRYLQEPAEKLQFDTLRYARDCLPITACADLLYNTAFWSRKVSSQILITLFVVCLAIWFSDVYRSPNWHHWLKVDEL